MCRVPRHMLPLYTIYTIISVFSEPFKPGFIPCCENRASDLGQIRFSGQNITTSVVGQIFEIDPQK